MDRKTNLRKGLYNNLIMGKFLGCNISVGLEEVRSPLFGMGS
jgi:hypothetical protein